MRRMSAVKSCIVKGVKGAVKTDVPLLVGVDVESYINGLDARYDIRKSHDTFLKCCHDYLFFVLGYFFLDFEKYNVFYHNYKDYYF